MTKTRCLKLMRRLLPSIARREAYVKRNRSGDCEVGYAILSERGDAGPREKHLVARGTSWNDVYRKAELVVNGRGE